MNDEKVSFNKLDAAFALSVTGVALFILGMFWYGFQTFLDHQIPTVWFNDERLRDVPLDKPRLQATFEEKQGTFVEFGFRKDGVMVWRYYNTPQMQFKAPPPSVIGPPTPASAPIKPSTPPSNASKTH